MSIRQKRAVWLTLAAAIAVLDLWSKELWEYPPDVPYGAGIEQATAIDGWLHVTTIWNPGAVWSLAIASSILLWTTGLAIPLVAVWIFYPPRARRWETAAKCLILGGAIGNFYDRVRWGAVRDWIDVEFAGAFNGWHWPTFNVADMSLVGGIGVLLLLSFFPERPPEGTAA